MKTNSLVGYEDFVGIMAANLIAKDEKDKLETDEEFQQIVSMVFRTAVAKYMKDSKLYTVELPIDLYQDTKRYDITPPEGYTVSSVIGLLENKIKIPTNSYDTKNIWLSCCPNKDVNKAFYVEVALSPKRISGPCEFDSCFIEENYDAIETLMLAKMSEMTGRSWKAKTSGELLNRRYDKMVQGNIHDAITGGSCIKVKQTRLSDRATRQRTNLCGC